MSEEKHCSKCGKPVPGESPRGICPACLMEQAMASRTIVTGQPDAELPPPPSPGEIADKFPQYEVLECLGRGGMGVVYKARQKSLDRWVAIKVLAPERVHDERFAEHFEREAKTLAKTLAKMSHPNIVTVFDHGETGGLFYIVMEFVDGVNLRDLHHVGSTAIPGIYAKPEVDIHVELAATTDIDRRPSSRQSRRDPSDRMESKRYQPRKASARRPKCLPSFTA